MRGRDGSDKRITSSQIATFVYCARKHSIASSLPPDYVEPAAVRDRREEGVSYHRSKGRTVVVRSLMRVLLFAAGILALAGALIIWLR